MEMHFEPVIANTQARRGSLDPWTLDQIISIQCIVSSISENKSKYEDVQRATVMLSRLFGESENRALNWRWKSRKNASSILPYLTMSKSIVFIELELLLSYTLVTSIFPLHCTMCSINPLRRCRELMVPTGEKKCDNSLPCVQCIRNLVVSLYSIIRIHWIADIWMRELSNQLSVSL